MNGVGVVKENKTPDGADSCDNTNLATVGGEVHHELLRVTEAWLVLVDPQIIHRRDAVDGSVA